MDIETLKKIKELDRSILNPKRFAILALLYMLGPQPISNIVRILELSWSEVETHIRRLRDDGLVEVRRRIVGNKIRVVVSLTLEGEKRFTEIAQLLEDLIRKLRR